MTMVLRVLVVYAVLLLVFRIASRRTLGEMTAFDLVLVLVISETTQQALLGEDHSLATAVIEIVTLVALDIFVGWLSFRFRKVDRLLEGEPALIVVDGKPIRERLAKEHITHGEILAAARASGVESMAGIRYAVLESDGAITIVPAREIG